MLVGVLYHGIRLSTLPHHQSPLKRISQEDLILFATLVLAVVQVELHDPDGSIQTFLSAVEEEEKRRQQSETTAPRRLKECTRKKFSQVISEEFPEATFRRYFRMGRDSFFKLCNQICAEVGEDEFRPERCVDNFNRTYRGAVRKSGGAICGEVRVAIFIRLLAGASYLDLMVIFDLCHQPVFMSFHMVCNWIQRTLKFPFVRALEDEDVDYFERVSADFAYAASDGVFKGCIGALDGLAVRIKRPVATATLRDPGAYFCRKGFFALNCQGICDFQKRLIWVSSRHIGSCHDSVAFTDTKLYELLQKKKDFLVKQGYFIVGDSAYNMESFLLVPYPQPSPRSMEDAYNYYHSNCRIRIECTFGEIVMRWGIFWRSLQFNINQVGDIVASAGLVHNFIIDERLEEDTLYISSFSSRNLSIEADTTTINDNNLETAMACVTDNNEPKPSGRPSASNVRSREIGQRIRLTLCLSLDSCGMGRPMLPGFKTNDCGMIYMDY